MNKLKLKRTTKKHRLAMRYDDETALNLQRLSKKWNEWSIAEIVAKALKTCVEVLELSSKK